MVSVALLATAPASQGKGYGGTLLDAIIDLVRRSYLTKVIVIPDFISHFLGPIGRRRKARDIPLLKYSCRQIL